MQAIKRVGASRERRIALVGRRCWVTLGLVICVVALIGCGGSSGGSTNKSGGSTPAGSSAAKSVLRIGLPYSAYQFYPNPAAISTSGGSSALEYSIAYSSLFHLLPDGSTVGELATSGHYFNTGRGPDTGFLLTLRHGVEFSDGSPLNAAAVVDWFNFYAKQVGGFNGLFGPKPTFTAVGQWTVRMKLSQPTANLPRILSDDGDYWGTIASPKCVANPKLFTNATCGAGPYMLDSAATVPNSSYSYVPNPHYYDTAAVKYSGVDIKVIPLASSTLAALQAGQLDFASVGADTTTVASAKAAGLTVLSAPSAAYQLLLNLKDPSTKALQNVKVRQALSYALNRPALAQLIGAGGYSAASQVFPVTDVSSSTVSNSFTYDPAKAKALLAAAGYAHGLHLGIVIVTARSQDQKMYAGIAQELSAVGITTTAVNYTPAAVSQNAAYLGTQFANTTPSQYLVYLKPSPIQTFGTNQTVVSLYDQGARASNPVPAWTKLWEYVSKQAYFVTVCTVSNIWYASDRVGGLQVTEPRVGAVLIGDLHPTG
jgi:peptide/nickel transport system substrate-binding protein